MSTVTPKIPEESSKSVRDWSLLIADGERGIRDLSKEIAESLGFTVHTAETAMAATRQLEVHVVHGVVLDLKLPGANRLELLHKIKQRHPQVEVIIVTGHASVDLALADMKNGVYSCLRKPFDANDLKQLLEGAMEHLRFSLENRIARESINGNPGFGGMVGRSTEMVRLCRIVARVASSRHPVLIQGESGSGKGMAARAIHFTGPLCERPFVAIDCGAMFPTFLEREMFGYIKGAFPGAIRPKEGLLSLALGGTVFLDEIGEMPLELQGALLRALQERKIRPVGSAKTSPIDVRILAATSRDLEISTHQGTFRRDLYSRLNVVNLRLPPLRDRKEDIRPLVNHFLERISRSKGVRHSISTEAMTRLLAYDWPGNVRELEECLKRSSALSSGPVLSVEDLPAHIQNAIPQPILVSPSRAKTGIVPLAQLEKEAILGALHQLGGDKVMTARLLGIGKTTLYRRLKEYGMLERWDMTPAGD
jgi:two-component system response regulator HydG